MWEGDRHWVWETVARHVLSLNIAATVHIAFAISNPIGIDQLPIPTRFWNVDAVPVAGDGFEVI